MYTLKLPIYIPTINWRSANYRSAHDLFSQFSRSCERGAVRFLFWWLFLHRRLRSGNEAQLSSNHSPPSAGPLQRVLLVFIRIARESLATLSSKPFGFDSGRLRNNSRLLILSPGCHHTV